jgi:hypothetical protein
MSKLRIFDSSVWRGIPSLRPHREIRRDQIGYALGSDELVLVRHRSRRI